VAAAPAGIIAGFARTAPIGATARQPLVAKATICSAEALQDSNRCETLPASGAQRGLPRGRPQYREAAMTQTAPKPITSLRYARRHAAKGSRFLGMIRTTDPKDIAILYLVTSFAFFMAGGAMAMLIRAELARPGLLGLSQS
jgi:hypothetical protein